MAAGTQDRTARTIGALVGALVLAALGVLLTSGSQRGLAALMALVGLAVGLAAGLGAARAGVLGSRNQDRSVIERLNDGAFVVVLGAASLLLAITARPWTVVLPGVVGGALAGRFIRR